MKTLKLTLVLLAFLALSAKANAQSPFDKFYEKYSTQEGYTAVNISKELFQMFASMGDQKDTSMREMKKVMDQLNGLKVLSCKPDSLKPGKATIFYNEAVAIFNNSAYKELMTVNDDGSNIRFLTKQDGKGKITEMVMMAKGKDEIVVLDMTGLIDLSTISHISKSLNIHGMEKLRNVPSNRK
jgi:DNA repair exonuclease SbcCD ATPase subunit